MRPSLPGSGKLGTPWARTHRENLSDSALTCCCSAWFGGPPPFGSRCRQALRAAWNRELLTPSCCRLGLAVPLPSGSGYFDTPLERMQPAKASAPFACADAAEALEEELLCVAVEPSCAT